MCMIYDQYSNQPFKNHFLSFLYLFCLSSYLEKSSKTYTHIQIGSQGFQKTEYDSTISKTYLHLIILWTYYLVLEFNISYIKRIHSFTHNGKLMHILTYAKLLKYLISLIFLKMYKINSNVLNMTPCTHSNLHHT